MKERITLISLFHQKNLEKIHSILKIVDEPLCKVPFGKNVVDRRIADTLPYHITISTWSIDFKDFILQEFSNIHFKPFKINVDGIEIMNGKENSYVLYFHMKDCEELKSLQEKFSNILPNEIYLPKEYHITITIEKDYEKIVKIKKKLKKSFVPFDLEIDSIGLFEIYPANLIHTINCENE